jgi:hypothetical protein
MKKLTTAEYEQLSVKGKGRSSPVFNSIINLKIGEALLIEKKDWNRKAAPGTLVRYIEKKQKIKFTCCAIENGNGWVVKRIENASESKEQKAVQGSMTNDKLQLKSDVLLFYIGRMAFHKIERIEDSIRACTSHFWKNESHIITELFHEIIKGLAEQGHIVIEHEKTYIPLRRN